ncbi:50S ribosomal protein L21 [bacterium]|nr:50S ribosomal protein L21 [bacterium]
MFAVIRTGGKQYCIKAGDSLSIEKLPGEVGETITISDVLLLKDGNTIKVGRPTIAGASVTFQITAQTKGKKLIVFKKIRRKGKQLKKGHRQKLTRVQAAAIKA